ncbi:hypothetical protein [Pseudoalteromonas rubra]|uniref:hypothetical protein n=1 Tax=Pseudoalteromonas rubra TaxID=43658 RepID=UPI002DB7FCD3|nr:hypothetical protein [Pseudoalteromonas rubra]MEC4091631.1 hypothetical protein [Pseudoalteromonas rubra]
MSLSNSLARGVVIEQSIRGQHEQQQQQKLNNARAGKRIKMAEEQHQAGMARDQLSLQALTAQLDHQKQLQPLQLAAAQTAGESAKIGNSTAKIQNRAAEQALTQQQHQWQRQLETEQQAKNKQRAAFLFPHVMNTLQQSNWDWQAAADEFPEYFQLTADMPNEFNFRYLMDDGQRQAIYQAKDYLDPNTPSHLGDEQALQVMNQVFGDQINRGEGVNPTTGKAIVDKAANGIFLVPGQPGKLALSLGVTDEDGNTYTAPRTMNASTDDADKVKLIDAGQAADQLKAKFQVARAVEHGMQVNPQSRQQLEALYKKLNNPSTPLKAGHMRFGNGSAPLDQVFDTYQSYLPDKEMQPEEYAIATQAMPFHFYRWAGGDETKMRYVMEAAERNKQVIRIHQQKLAELDPNDYAGLEKVNQEMATYYVDPTIQYQEALTRNGNDAKNQRGNDSKVQGVNDSKVQRGNASRAARAPKLSLEEFALTQQAQELRDKQQRPQVNYARRESPHVYSYGSKSLDELYNQYSERYDEETKSQLAREQLQARQVRQQEINQLSRQLQAGQLDEAGKARLQQLLTQQKQ